ncbi:MAG TPA: hypothetical protein VFY95_01875 [Sphingomicrobium sp.]
MPNTYRIYRLDRANHIVDVEWISASDDQEAIAAARGMKNSGRREVWLGDRLVATLLVATSDEPSAAFWL